MDYSFIIQNKELFKTLYAFVVVIICILIVIKTDKLFKLSLHDGIRYFRNAFFFYGVAFVIRYFLKFAFYEESLSYYSFLIGALFEFFLVMAGFFLLYSLLWKKFESYKFMPFSSLLNPRILIFYALAIVIVLLDFLWINYLFLFITQILVFLYASFISYSNYKKDNYEHKFPKFYFIAMILTFFAWLLNALAQIFFNWDQVVMLNIYILNALFFLLFLYGVIKVTKN